jgi:putative ABC transport system permease protein
VRVIRRQLRAPALTLFALTACSLVLAVPWLGLAGGMLFAGWLAGSRRGRQSLAMTWLGLATIPRRLGATSVVVVGIAGVVGVLVALLAMAQGFQSTLKRAGDEETAIVLRAGANAELSSGLDRTAVTLIAQAPGVMHDAHDVPVASAEVVVVSNVPKRTTGTDANVEVRGVGSQVWHLRPEVHIVEGRRFRPGLRELIVGKGALAQFRGLATGSTVRLNGQVWTVVGIFASGDSHESEIWGDAESVAAAYRRSGFQSVSVRLRAADAIEAFKAALAGDPRLRVDVETTREYYNKQSERLSTVIRAIGYGVTLIMALGAVFGALNTMYAAIAARTREIATLRALGFSGLPVVVSIMLETMLLAFAGGMLGAGIAWTVFNGYTVSTLGGNFSQVVFRFQVTPELLLRGLQWALAIGLLGGLFPALRAVHLPVTQALREL